MNDDPAHVFPGAAFLLHSDQTHPEGKQNSRWTTAFSMHSHRRVISSVAHWIRAQAWASCHEYPCYVKATALRQGHYRHCTEAHPKCAYSFTCLSYFMYENRINFTCLFYKVAKETQRMEENGSTDGDQWKQIKGACPLICSVALFVSMRIMCVPQSPGHCKRQSQEQIQHQSSQMPMLILSHCLFP